MDQSIIHYCDDQFKTADWPLFHLKMKKANHFEAVNLTKRPDFDLS